MAPRGSETMHPVLSKAKLSNMSFEMKLLGEDVTVEVDDGSSGSNADYKAPSTLTIIGISQARALDLLHMGVAAEPAAGVPAHHESRAADEKARQEAAFAKAREGKKPEQMSLPATNAPPAQGKVIDAKASEVKSDPVDDVGDDLDDGAPVTSKVDVDFLVKQEKLRPILEHVASTLTPESRTVEKLVAACVDLHKNYSIPQFKVVADKGPFDKRIERAAMVVLSPTDAAK